MRKQRGLSLIGLGIPLLVGCTPTQPTNIVPATVISVAVIDGAERSVPGAIVEIEDSTHVRVSKATDSNGRTSFDGKWANPITLRVSKEGFSPSSGTSTVTGNPGVWLVRLSSTEPTLQLIAGEYSLTIEIAKACAGIPDELRTRRYGATVEAGRAVTGGILSYWVTVDSHFLTMPYSFEIGLSGGTLALLGEGTLSEHIPPLGYLDINLRGRTTVDDLAPSTLVIPYDGSADYCVLNSPRSGVDHCFTTPPVQIVSRETCKSADNTLVLSPLTRPLPGTGRGLYTRPGGEPFLNAW